jgi:Protein of unknown function (DUF3102)
MATYNADGYAVNLAARIRAELDGVQAAAKTGIEHALNAGDLLIQAQKRLKHGEWTPWLKEHVKISDRTARLYIQLAKNRQKIEASNRQRIADFTIQGALELISAPRTSASRSKGNPDGGARRSGETRYAPAHLNSLMWLEASAQTRRKFADAVGHEVLDSCSPNVRDAIVERWLTDEQRKLVQREHSGPPQSPSPQSHRQSTDLKEVA